MKNYFSCRKLLELVRKKKFSEGRADKPVARKVLNVHCPEVVGQVTHAGKNIIRMIIPKGTTEKVQLLDVYGFRIWKNYVRHFSDSAILLDYDSSLHIRNNIIKLHNINYIINYVHQGITVFLNIPGLEVVTLQKSQENLRIR